MLGKTLDKIENCVNVLILTLENLLLAVWEQKIIQFPYISNKDLVFQGWPRRKRLMRSHRAPSFASRFAVLKY